MKLEPFWPDIKRAVALFLWRFYGPIFANPTEELRNFVAMQDAGWEPTGKTLGEKDGIGSRAPTNPTEE